MTHRNSLRSLLLLILLTLLIFGVSPLLAQDTALTQSAHLSGDGLTLTISYPAGWVEDQDANAQNIYLASNAAALDQIKSGLVTAPGQVGVVAYLPSFLDNLSVSHTADPSDVLNAYLQAIKVAGDVQTSTDFTVTAATTVVANIDKPAEKALLGALAFPAGTVLFGVTPSKALNPTVTAVINSITLTSDQSTPQATEPPTPPATEQIGSAPTTFNVTQSNGDFQFSITLPNGWVNEYDAGVGLINIANTQSALDKLTHSRDPLATGEVGIAIDLPTSLKEYGLTIRSAPTDVLTAFESQTSATGEIHPDSSFSVPAARAVATGGYIPKGDAVLYSLAFDGGTIFLGVLPAAADDTAMQAILHSIQFTAVGGASATPEAQPTQASTETVTPNATTFNVTQPNGSFQLSIALPDGWVNQYDANFGQLNLANTQSALEAILHSNNLMAAGDMGITLVLPSALPGLGLTMTSDPNTVLTTFETQAKVTGQIQTDTSFSVPAAAAVVTGGNMPSGGAAVYALAFDGGTIFLGVLPAAADDAAMQAVLHSIQFTAVGGASATPEATEASIPSVSLNPTTIDVDQPLGRLEVSISIPDGWVIQNDNSGFIFIGSSQSAVDNISGTTGAPGLGESGLTILLPDQIAHVGVTHTGSPTAVLTDFEKAFSATGQIQTDSSFSVPAAYAHLAGDKLPPGGGVGYALSFDGGMLLIVTQPDNEFDATLVAILHTIGLSAAAETPVTLEPQPTAAPTEAPTAVSQTQLMRQWAASADGSTEYGTDSWSFTQATGKPNTSTCDDNITAWASQESTGSDTLRLTFTHPVIPSQINVYQTYNPGAITSIEVGSSANPDQLTPLPNSADNSGNTACPGVFSVDVTGITTPVDYVVIHLDQSITQNWDEIDAVQLVGTAP